MHAVCTFPAKRKYTVHLEVKWGGKLICNIAATILKGLQIQSSVGESGIICVETFRILYDMLYSLI